MSLKVNKIVPTKGEYGLIFDVALPVRFYFNKDGTFDGIEISAEKTNEKEGKLAEELCQELAQATGKQSYKLVGKIEDEQEVIYRDSVIKVYHDEGDSERDGIAVKFKGVRYNLVGFDEVEDKDTHKTEFLLKIRHDKKLALVYPMRIRNILKPSVLLFILEELGWEIKNMREILAHQEKLERQFEKHDARKGEVK